MEISVQGIGWFTKEGYGCIRSGQRQSFEPGDGIASLPKKGIFSHPFKNFGRLDLLSRSVAYAVALALQDAGIEYSPLHKQSIGIVGTSQEGSLRTDIDYFEDYIRSGRTLSRANLFIYTLPSSPLGEAAIHFGFLGPLFYAASGDGSLNQLLDMASGMIEGREAARILAGTAGVEEAVFLVLGTHSPATTAVCTLEEAKTVLAEPSSAAGMIHSFSQLSARKGFS